MPAKRRKIPPKLIDQRVPPWAQRLLQGERPKEGTPEHDAYIGWKYFNVEVAGLPDPRSHEGYLLWSDR